MKIWDFKPSGDLFTTVAVGAAVAPRLSFYRSHGLR